MDKNKGKVKLNDELLDKVAGGTDPDQGDVPLPLPVPQPELAEGKCQCGNPSPYSYNGVTICLNCKQMME
jgi:hypothetical protein